MEEEEEEEEGEFARIMEEIERLGSASDADSDLEVDDMSLQSTPRPRLRPFFAHQRVTSASEDTLFRKSPVPPAATAAPAVAEQVTVRRFQRNDQQCRCRVPCPDS